MFNFNVKIQRPLRPIMLFARRVRAYITSIYFQSSTTVMLLSTVGLFLIKFLIIVVVIRFVLDDRLKNLVPFFAQLQKLFLETVIHKVKLPVELIVVLVFLILRQVAFDQWALFPLEFRLLSFEYLFAWSFLRAFRHLWGRLAYEIPVEVSFFLYDVQDSTLLLFLLEIGDCCVVFPHTWRCVWILVILLWRRKHRLSLRGNCLVSWSSIGRFYGNFLLFV